MHAWWSRCAPDPCTRVCRWTPCHAQCNLGSRQTRCADSQTAGCSTPMNSSLLYCMRTSLGTCMRVTYSLVNIHTTSPYRGALTRHLTRSPAWIASSGFLSNPSQSRSSFFSNHVQTSSLGFNQGEYGSRNTSLAPRECTATATIAVRWVLALSKNQGAGRLMQE
jgi:hypothetical protein